MKKTTLLLVGLAASFCFGFYTRKENEKPVDKSITTQKTTPMKVGAFSISLSVKDINASKKFYEAMGFTVLGGDLKKNYLIMKNGNALIGLFQGMFKGNILTFNPGWDESGNKIGAFDDVRKIQQQLKNSGIKLDSEADEATAGPANFMLTDPDGNVILFDQHI